MSEESRVVTRQEGPTIIHERTDSKGILADLFKNVQNPRSDKTFRERNLPESFFKPPRETSKEFPVPGNTSGVFHTRSRSDPGASLNQPLSLAPEINLSTAPTYSANQSHNTQQHHTSPTAHYRQKSVPNPQAASHQQPLWHVTLTNSAYKVGCLQDGRIVFQNRATNSLYYDSPVMRDQILGPLNPEQWTAHVDRGEMYYVDHATRSTTWFDPRLQKEVQEPSIHFRHQQNQALQSQLQQPQPHQRQVSGSSLAQSTTNSLSQSHQHAQQQPNNYVPNQAYGVASSGNSRAVPPSLSQAQQQPLIRQAMGQQQQTGQYELELRREREHMRLRQKEIEMQQQQQQQQLYSRQATTFHDHNPQMSQATGMQEQLMRRQIGDDYMLNSPVSPLANMRANDPFLYHGRQESGDSGFSVSTPQTPENFLAQNMEELSLYTNPGLESWQPTDSVMDVSVDNNNAMIAGAQQADQVMTDNHDDLADMYFSDLESVLANPITWL